MSPDHLTMSPLEFLEKTRQLTLNENESIHVIVSNVVEELGEFVAAESIESGRKLKPPPPESSKIEAADTIFCALSLFFQSGATVRELIDIAEIKFQKWQRRIDRKLSQ